jgi:hypothetical protein
MRRIRIATDDVSVEADLNETSTAKAIWNALPIHSKANTWGDEVYFSIGLKLAEESPREVVELGDLGYWPPGRAMCLFFGRTPASRGDEIRPASPVNVFGKITGDARDLRRVKDGDKIKVEAIGETDPHVGQRSRSKPRRT